MTRLVAVSHKLGGAQPVEKYVKQTYQALSDNNINLEAVAIQIASLPIREQKKFFRLLLNYIDVVSIHKNPAMQDIIILCEKLIDVVNDHYEQQDQLILEGM